MANRRITVRTMVLNRQNKILVLRRSLDDDDVPWRIDFPGGGVEPGEALMAAAIRETKEETGIELTERDLSLEYAFSVYDEETDTVITRLLFVAYVASDAVSLSHEHIEFGWRDMSTVQELFSETSWSEALYFVRNYRLTPLS